MGDRSCLAGRGWADTCSINSNDSTLTSVQTNITGPDNYTGPSSVCIGYKTPGQTTVSATWTNNVNVAHIGVEVKTIDTTVFTSA